jgi:hypothetical protein
MALTVSQFLVRLGQLQDEVVQVDGGLGHGLNVDGVRVTFDHDLVVDGPADDLVGPDWAGPLRPAAWAVALVDMRWTSGLAMAATLFL